MATERPGAGRVTARRRWAAAAASLGIMATALVAVPAATAAVSTTSAAFMAAAARTSRSMAAGEVSPVPVAPGLPPHPAAIHAAVPAPAVPGLTGLPWSPPVEPGGLSVTDTPWRIKAAPNELGPQGYLTGESCAGPKWCMAVGYYHDDANYLTPLAEEWQGRSWTVLSVPPTPGSAPGGEFTGVSCTTPSFCTAVGYYFKDYYPFSLAETWNGTEWAVQPTPNPPPSRATYLYGVSCTSTAACVAVGVYESHYCECSGTWVTLAEQWNGTGWVVEPTPDQAGVYNALYAVSCVSATCVAAGFFEPEWTSPRTLAEIWNGSAWSLQTVADPAGHNAALYSVTCTAATSCTAAGYAENAADYPWTLAETWDGSAWTVQKTPNPTGAMSAALYGIACSSGTSCTAVGELRRTVTQVGAPFSLSWNGKAWKVRTVPIPAGALLYSGLLAVACPSPAACAAAGYYQSSSGALVTLLEGWDGKRWSTETSPATGELPSYLYGVACPSSHACTAVGIYVNGEGTGVTFAQEWNGSAWTIEHTPDPATGTGWASLVDVSCPSARRCIAVGDYQDPLGAYRPLAETWNGKAWSISPAPNPGRAINSYLSGISCRSITSCMAVGYYYTITGTALPLAERWDGTSWAILPAPPAPHAVITVLTSVACPSATCIAVGAYEKKPSHPLTFAESWNGTSWRQQEVPVPPQSTASALYQVACSSSTACTAVGPAARGGATVTLAEAWNGTSWTVQSTPNPAFDPTSILTGVSCRSARSCTAVGYAVNTSTIVLTLAEAWNGSTWSIENTPNAHGPAETYTGSFLDTVACLQTGTCTAVGYSENSTFISKPLVLRQAR